MTSVLKLADDSDPLYASAALISTNFSFGAPHAGHFSGGDSPS